MKVKPFSLTLDGNWQTLALPEFFIGLQVLNESVNAGNVELQISDVVYDELLIPGRSYSFVTPNPLDPVRAVVKVRGTNGEKVCGEVWKYDFQE